MSIQFAGAQTNVLAPPSVYTFTNPFPLARWQAPPQAGVYAILVADPSCQPQPFRVIYFGEAGNFSERGFPSNHHKSQAWQMTAGAGGTVFIATYAMPSSTPEQRRAVESALCGNYKPSCNG